jgi:hypothetical protein
MPPGASARGRRTLEADAVDLGARVGGARRVVPERHPDAGGALVGPLDEALRAGRPGSGRPRTASAASPPTSTTRPAVERIATSGSRAHAAPTASAMARECSIPSARARPNGPLEVDQKG